LKQICLVVTNKCNWFCDYCSMDTHNRSISFNEVKQIVDNLESNLNVCLTGGEPGLLKSSQMDYIINELKKKNTNIELTTNGMFFKNHSKHLKDINHILYHCTEDMEGEIFIPDNVDLSKVEFMVVVTDKNLKNLKSFLEKYNQIKFRLYKGDEHIVNGVKGPSLSIKNAINIIREFKNIISEDSPACLLGIEDPDTQIEIIGKKYV
jgi:organic radical activating enzyme